MSTEPTNGFAIKVGELSAALMQGLCHEDGDNHSLYQELYDFSDSGMVGPWVCCAEVAEAAEYRFGDLWESEGRNFIDDTEYLPEFIMRVARDIKKQPQGIEEITRVLDLFEQQHPTQS